MHKFLFLLLLSMAGTYVYGQSDSLSKAERRLLDSMFNSDEFIKLLMKEKESYVDLCVGTGNSIFSINNNALNAGQAQTSKIYYKPAVGYHHKSGFTLMVSGFLADDAGKLKIYQFAISPSYVFSNKQFDAGISYTRFMEGLATSFTVSPFKNDCYANAVYKKTWIQPGIGLGYAFGKQVEYVDSSFWFLNRVIHIRDSITTRLGGLSLNLSATHEWNFYALLNKQDALKLKPLLMLNAGSQRWNTSHSSSLNQRRPLVQHYLKTRFGDGSTAAKFTLQSLAFLGYATYYYGKFYLQPQVYLDYYLPSTTEKRLTSLFAVTAGVSFN